MIGGTEDLAFHLVLGLSYVLLGAFCFWQGVRYHRDYIAKGRYL